MSPTAALVRKEVHAASALWLAIAAAMIAGLLPERALRDFGSFFYVVGALVLGANAMGHEYRHGTLAQLLAQPVARTRIFAAKMAVLATLLMATAAVAAVIVFSRFRWYPADRDGLVALFVLPVVYGLLVAPWLTIATRSTLAGTLFSGSFGALLLLGGRWLGMLRADAAADIDTMQMQVLWTGSALLCLGAAIGLWHSFARLQVTDGVRSEIRLAVFPGAGRRTAARRRHPVVLLVAKELRLQQLTFVAPILYILLCLALSARGTAIHSFEGAIGISTIINGLAIIALAGAFSSAEERVLGTLESQMLQPMSARAQFAVKVAVTGLLASLLAIGLPVAMASLLGTHLQGFPPIHYNLTMLAVLLSGSIYVSSVSASALGAFIACIPAFVASIWFVNSIAVPTARMVFLRFHERPHGPFLPIVPIVGSWPADIAAAVFVLLLLGFAFENHRVADRSHARALREVLIAGAYVMVTCVAFAAAGRVLFL